MNASDISDLVTRELASYVYEPPPPGTTLGVPWSGEEVRGYVVQLRSALVAPYLQKFKRSDTVAQINAVPPETAEYWVVAVSPGYIEFYDSNSGEFGLAAEAHAGGLPVTIGVWGDLVGVFCAI